LLRKVFEKHYGSPKKTSPKKRGKENRDEPGPSKQRDSENLTDSISTFDNSPMLKRAKQPKYFQNSKNFPQPNDNEESENLDDARDITGEIYVKRLSKQTRTPWTKEEDLKLIAGMKLYKNSNRWISIKNKFFKDSHRSHVNIKDRRRTLVNNGTIDKND